MKNPPPLRFVVLLVGGLLAVAVAVALRMRPHPPDAAPPPPTPAADPRLTFPTPYRNVRPGVAYVGDAACADCHDKETKTYRHHPMGQALAPVAEATPIERYGPAAHDPLTTPGLRYDIARRDGHVFHRETLLDSGGQEIATVEREIFYAIGSGARARSYAVGRDGYLFQSPLTWYPHAGRWDLSPSYETRNQHFSRPIAPGCLFCHANAVDHVAGTVNRYRLPIFRGFVVGCERCHGPGELHVRRPADTAPDDTIVNPARLEPALRDAVCEQCHVQGEQRVVGRGRGDFDYRPGLPLYPFLMDFIDGGARHDAKFVSSVEQMRASRCYRESQPPKKLGCISCHDPHRHPTAAEKVAHYRERCFRCHTDSSCRLLPPERRARQPDDSCIACHMPPTHSEVNHTSITDHSVPRRPGPKVPTRRPTPGPDDLVPFHREQIAADDSETRRNLGLARMAMLDRGLPDAVARAFATKALPLLDEAVLRDADDHPAREGRGDARWLLGRLDEAAADFATVLAARPDAEGTLLSAGNLALARGRPEEARALFERVQGVNPWRWQYVLGAAKASFRLGDAGRAEREARRALDLDPTHTPTRSLLVQCCLAQGKTKEAEAEYRTLRAMTPAERRGDLLSWYEDQVRRLTPGPRR